MATTTGDGPVDGVHDRVSALKAKLDAAGRTGLADRILRLARPAVRIATEPSAESRIPVGASRFGGAPDMPPGREWPAWKGRRLAFLAQINLADLKVFPCCSVLPPSGLLQFFYDLEQSTWGFDPKDRGSWAVRWEKATDGLERRKVDVAHPAARVAFSPATTLPEPDSPEFERLGLDRAQVRAWEEAIGEAESGSTPRHQLLGHAEPVQGDMHLECQLASNGISTGDSSAYRNPRASALVSGASDWRLLLQLDSDEHCEMMWGDLGRLYFWITERALASRAFEETWMVLQCS